MADPFPSHSNCLDTELIKKRKNHKDLTDKNAIEYQVTTCDIFWTVLSMCMRFVAVFVNVFLAWDYYRHDKMTNFGWTAVCIVFPMIITTVIYMNMYFQDKRVASDSVANWSFLEMIWMLLISPFFFRYWRSLLYTLKCKRAEKLRNRDDQKLYYKLMIKEESDVSLVRIFECFLETAPQKIVQISIVLASEDIISYIQIASICSCFVSMAWCMVVYHRYNRYAQVDKEVMNSGAVALQFLWHFCIAVSRTLCIATAASLFPPIVLLAILVRALAFGTITYFTDKPKFCSSAIFCNYMFCLILGFIYTFTYIMPKDGQTRLRYISYYLICIIENSLCIFLFSVYAPHNLSGSILFIPFCGISIAFYCIGILFMLLYYKFFHPNVTIRNPRNILNNN